MKMEKVLRRRVLLTLGLLGMAGAGIAVGYAIGHNQKTSIPPPPTSIETGIKITDQIDSRYIINSNVNIYYSYDSSWVFGHKLLDLKALSNDNDGKTFFTIVGEVDFGLLVNPDMDCHINGTDNANVVCDSTSTWAGGLVVGRNNVNNEYLNYNYTGKLQIDDNVTFSVSSVQQPAHGVIVNSTLSVSVLTINGTFDVSSSASGAYGCYFNNYTRSSSQTFNGKFNIHGYLNSSGIYYNYPIYAENSNQTFNGTYDVVSSAGNAYGVWILFGDTTISAGSTQICNGTFNIRADTNYSAWGIYFVASIPERSKQIINGIFVVSSGGSAAYGIFIQGNTNVTSTQTINGVFTISSLGFSCGVSFYDIRGNTTINGTFTIYSSNNQCTGVTITQTFPNSTLTINGTFAIVTDSSGAPCVGVVFTDSANVGAFYMDDAHFFSNKVDDGNIFTKYPDDQSISYEWNGQTMNDSSHTSTTDGSLTLRPISDDDTNLTIKVIDNAIPANKQFFNNKYKSALEAYVKSKDCPAIVKPWLKNIIGQI